MTMPRMIRPTSITLAAGYVLFGVAALVLFALPLGYSWLQTMDDSRMAVLNDDAERMTAVYRRGGLKDLNGFINERVGLRIPGERLLLLVDPARQPLAGNIGAWPRGVPDGAGSYRSVQLQTGDRPVRVSLVRANLPGGYTLLVARDVDWLAPITAHFWYGLAGAVAALCITGIIGGVLLSRALQARIQSVRQTVSAIMQGDLSHRVPTTGSSMDELDTLSQVINRLLDQIQLLVQGISNVSNAVAHDLRTPLTELRSRLEELSLTRPEPDETFAEVDAAVADVDQVIRIFNALLRLAEIDSGLKRSGFVRVDLADIVGRAVEFYGPAAEEKNITLAFDRQTTAPQVAGDHVLISQAINNLIDNALKYTPAGGHVTVSASTPAGSAPRITVADNGPGIPAAQRPKVTERFFRGDASRGTPGVGLGLSLVDAIARLHGGALTLDDNHPGLRASLDFPGS